VESTFSSDFCSVDGTGKTFPSHAGSSVRPQPASRSHPEDGSRNLSPKRPGVEGYAEFQPRRDSASRRGELIQTSEDRANNNWSSKSAGDGLSNAAETTPKMSSNKRVRSGNWTYVDGDSIVRGHSRRGFPKPTAAVFSQSAAAGVEQGRRSSAAVKRKLSASTSVSISYSLFACTHTYTRQKRKFTHRL